MMRVFIGYDARERVAASVLAHSILANATLPVAFTFLRREQLPVDVQRDPLASTDFADTRFLVPWLCGYKGWAVFMDCDMVCTQDICKLSGYMDDRLTVVVRKQDHQPVERDKFLGAAQTRYGRKNWSSLMLFNCARCEVLTPEYVNTASGLDLHQFKWVDGDEARIGALPFGWNFLVGHDEWHGDAPPALIHYTTGGPYFDEYRDVDHAQLWFDAYRDMVHCDQRVG